MERGCAEPLIKPHMFLTTMPGASCAASLAQHGVCTCPSAQGPQHRHTWGTCSSPPSKPHTLHGCALEPEKIVFWHLSSPNSKAMSNYGKLDSLFKTAVAIYTESNQKGPLIVARASFFFSIAEAPFSSHTKCFCPRCVWCWGSADSSPQLNSNPS